MTKIPKTKIWDEWNINWVWYFIFFTFNFFQNSRSDMASQGDGTGRPVPNQACNLATYHGGKNVAD